MLRLISAVLHEARGDSVRDESPDLRRLELVLVVPLVGLRCSSSPPGPPRSPTARSPTIDPTEAFRVITTPESRLARARADAGAARSIRHRAARQRACAVVDAPRLHGPWSSFAGFVTAYRCRCDRPSESADGRTLIAESFTRDRLGGVRGDHRRRRRRADRHSSPGARTGREHAGEYYALLAAAGAGMAFFVTAGNLMTLFLGLEWFSLSLYMLCAIDTDRETSLEAGLKYLIVGSFGSASCCSARRSSTARPASSASRRSAGGDADDECCSPGSR